MRACQCQHVKWCAIYSRTETLHHDDHPNLSKDAKDQLDTCVHSWHCTVLTNLLQNTVKASVALKVSLASPEWHCMNLLCTRFTVGGS